MSTMIVSCAGCGKRYKGASGQKSQCKACRNRITFPNAARLPAAGKILCSNCWNAFDLNGSGACKNCSKKISAQFGGGAAIDGAAASPAAGESTSAAPKVEMEAPPLPETPSAQ